MNIFFIQLTDSISEQKFVSDQNPMKSKILILACELIQPCR